MNKCIAFVDDDSKICRYFREYATYRGYACHCYQDAESALKGIVRNRERVWAICVDLTLPGSLLQGPELITELRVRGVSAPIFVVTEDTSPTTQLALTNKNIDGYIRKRDLTRPLLFKLIETAWEKRGYSGSIIAVTAVLTILFTKIRIAWWLRRWKFAFARTLIVLGSLGASVSGVIVIMAT